jgi:hypothetical protein
MGTKHKTNVRFYFTRKESINNYILIFFVNFIKLFVKMWSWTPVFTLAY